MTRPSVGVTPPEAYWARTRLWWALESVLGVSIHPRAPGEYAGLAALIALGDVELPDRGLPLLHAIDSEPPLEAAGYVSLSGEPCLDPRLRGRLLRESRCGPLPALAPDRAAALALIAGVPAWTSTWPSRRQQTAMLPAELAPSEVLRDRFKASRFLGLLPILELLRDVTEDAAPRAPGLRAALMLDDPNL